jgi:hypothetical protein
MNQECYPLDLQVCCFYCDEEVLIIRFGQFMHFSLIAGMSLTLATDCVLNKYDVATEVL